MAPAIVVWRGDAEEQVALLQAIANNCACVDEVSRGACPAHRALLDQRFLDGCLFARYLSERLLLEEFLVPNVR